MTNEVKVDADVSNDILVKVSMETQTCVSLFCVTERVHIREIFHVAELSLSECV